MYKQGVYRQFPWIDFLLAFSGIPHQQNYQLMNKTTKETPSEIQMNVPISPLRKKRLSALSLARKQARKRVAEILLGDAIDKAYKELKAK